MAKTALKSEVLGIIIENDKTVIHVVKYTDEEQDRTFIRLGKQDKYEDKDGNPRTGKNRMLDASEFAALVADAENIQALLDGKDVADEDESVPF